MSAMNKISKQEEMIRNLKSDLVQSQRGYDELRDSMHKKMSSLEMIIQNQLKIGAEDSFANYINLNDDMNYSLIKKNKGAPNNRRQGRKWHLRVQRARGAHQHGQAIDSNDGEEGPKDAGPGEGN